MKPPIRVRLVSSEVEEINRGITGVDIQYYVMKLVVEMEDEQGQPIARDVMCHIDADKAAQLLTELTGVL